MEWINTKDQKPPVGVKIKIAVEMGGEMWSSFECTLAEDIEEPCLVTHWMPLPELPQ
jgi:hypothetical protein